MHMNEMAGTARLVQRIDILGDGEHLSLMLPLEPRQRAMRLIRRGLRMPCPAQILEGMDRRGIANKALRRRHLFEVELRPQPALVAERGEPTLRRKAGAGQNDDLLKPHSPGRSQANPHTVQAERPTEVQP